MFAVVPLDGPFGVEIQGLDLSVPPSDELIQKLISTFHKHQVIKICRQAMNLDTFASIGKWFGKPHPHIVEMGHVQGYDYVSLLTNELKVRRNSAAYWHTDNTYEPEPASATMLWAKSVPLQGGATLVADMYAAYEALPAKMQKHIEGLNTLNGWISYEDTAFVTTERPPVPESRQANLGIVTHPLVLTHPVTGRKALYSVAGSSFGIENMPEDEGKALLRELKAHATHERFQLSLSYEHQDFAAWDTLATLHAATPHADPSIEKKMLREMYRISVKGLSPYAQRAVKTAKHPIQSIRG